MGYVEFLRARHAFVRFAIVLAACVAFADFSIEYALHNGHRHVDHVGSHQSQSYSIVVGGSTDKGDAPSDQDSDSLSTGHFTIPIGFVFGVAGFLAMGFGTILASSLNKENGRGGFAFTKPISRERLALTYLGIDLIAIFAAFLYTVLLAFASFAVLGIVDKVVVEPGAWTIAGVGLGAAVMWYGELQALTSMRISGAGLFVGLSWVAFIVGLPFYAIQFLGPIFHGLIVAFDFFNPLSYFALSSHNDEVTNNSIFGFSAATSLAITWAIGIATCGVAVLGWKRVEV